MKLLEEDESTNPIFSVANIVDVFLVVIAALLIAIAQNPLNPFFSEELTVIKNPGKDNMEIIIKKGKKIERHKSTGQIRRGDGVRAGIAYKLKDGSLIYVPENDEGS